MVATVAMVAMVTACGPGAPVKRLAAAPAAATTTVAPTTTTTDPGPPPGTFLVASPVSGPVQYFDSAGGAAVGTLPDTTWGGPTVRPVMSQTDSWIQIELDQRPNLSTAWVPRSSVTLAMTSYRIEVSIAKRSLTLYQNAQPIYSSPVGVGAPQWPTPMGRTFVDALVATPQFQEYIYGPTVLILGSHSDVFTEFDGGDGTVAIHGYPSDPGSTQGVAVSHGCVRASPETINAIAIVPLGSPVDVVA
jgi:lipoprotein-anchoring transpeptidase ErfK/SrfK